MNKRILIFSPYRADQEGLEYIILDYFRKKFKRVKDIEIQKFSDIGDSIKSENKIGLGGEIFVVFDRKISPEDKRKKPSEWTCNERIYFDSLKTLFELSKKICEKEEIPYIIYEGEIEKKEEGEIIRKLKRIEEKVSYRLESQV
ncbi:hypothetical protein DRN69_03615 [Candidatus Pacearchaeota archaeon]|nr:MAG: hypothetical protein DRN69_03615 [Candidatus Pacearchaeota archaeon]